MFKLLSKESNIFSIPVYIGFLLLIVTYFNVLNFTTLGTISAVITFAGVALAYFLFNKINLNYQTHLPLFIYTIFIVGLYPGYLDIGIAVSLFTNSFVLLLLTSTNDYLRKNAYLIVGAIMALNFFFLPTTWPMIVFIILHIIGTSDRIGLNLFRLFYGGFLIVFAYFSILYFFGANSWNYDYMPYISLKPQTNFYPIYWLAVIFLFVLLAILDHFKHYNEKSPTSRYKYSFVLIFSIAQITTILLYMGNNHEYLILLALPFSIIISRFLRFRSKYWVKEVGLWLIFISLILYKIGTYFDLNLF